MEAPTHAVAVWKGQGRVEESAPLWPPTDGVEHVVLDAARGIWYVRAPSDEAMRMYLQRAEEKLGTDEAGNSIKVMCRRVGLNPVQGREYMEGSKSKRV